jgi:hypothetical protein
MKALNNMQRQDKGGLLCPIHSKFKRFPDESLNDSVSISTMTHYVMSTRECCDTGSRQGFISVVI